MTSPRSCEIIMRNEIGLSMLLREEGYVQMPAFPSRESRQNRARIR